MVIQDTHLFTGTIADNIRYGRLDATDEDVVNAAKVANAYLYPAAALAGYEHALHSDGANLSQGQRQLLAIARQPSPAACQVILDKPPVMRYTRTENSLKRVWMR